MARARNIKPGFFTNDELGELSPLARLAFIGLWGQADFNGNMKYKPKRLKVEILPYDNADFATLVGELAEAGFVRIYEVAGDQFLHVVNFGRHQRPHKNEVLRGTDVPRPDTGDDPDGTDPESNGPDPDQDATDTNRDGTETEQERDENRSNPPDTGYRIPDTGSPQPDSEKNKGSADAKPARKSSANKFSDEDFEKFWKFCRDHWFGRVGTKAEAKEAFKKLKPETHDLREILRLTRQECEYRRRVEATEGFCENMKHVFRWIKREGWNDTKDRLEAGPNLHVVQGADPTKVNQPFRGAMPKPDRPDRKPTGTEGGQ